MAMQLPRRSISSTSSAGEEVPIVNMGNVLGDGFKLQVHSMEGLLVMLLCNTHQTIQPAYAMFLLRQQLE